jgi:hypothetical protein
MTTKVKCYQLWIYDVWGNAREGFEVNDRSRAGVFALPVKGETFNAGTEREFTTFEPTDRQLARLIGVRGCAFDWQEGSYYIEQKRNGRPEGELELLED